MTGSLQMKGDRYYAVLNFINQQGERKQKWISLNLPIKGNKRRADVMLNELLVTYQGIDYAYPMNTLLSLHIAAWVDNNASQIAKTTYDQYVSMVKNHIAPYFDSRKITLGKLTSGDLEDYYAFKINGGLRPNTVIKHHAVIRSALQWALKHRYINMNVADLADKPNRIRYYGAAPYSVEEIAQLLNLTQNEPISVPIFLASFYGLRRSEILGLRWSSIDFQRGIIQISTTVVKEKDGDHVRITIRDNTTKTEASMRTLPLCQYTQQYLLNLQARQLKNRELCGSFYDPQYLDFVCVNQMGNLLQPDHVSQRFQQLLSYYGLRPIRFHDLRHSCATIMLYLGYHLKDIQTWLGHSNYNFTADTYIHSSPTSHLSMADSYSDKLNELVPLSALTS